MRTSEVPETLEGWYVQHDLYTVDWARWQAVPAAERQALAAEASAWLRTQEAPEAGSSACYSVLGQKGDLLFVHFRPSLEALQAVKLSLCHSGFYRFLQPTYGYLSVIELALYEVTGPIQRKLAAAGLQPGTAEYESAYQQELEYQKEAMQARLYPLIPPSRYICFYPMSKKRGETRNWYALSMEERRELMRSHGMIGRKYAGKVTQIISGSTGLDDWEWGVSLFADDPLVFKKLVYEMRFDEASAYYALFGAFYVGIRCQPEALAALLTGQPAAPERSLKTPASAEKPACSLTRGMLWRRLSPVFPAKN
ncbi:MAG: putative heme-dependent peroxidase YwfI [Candidatus Tectimicrobiota bacterium]|nr:MAG: putative heme-dependent peroxidase YwfI [Candidatus Tectomicrobia bacterium]